MSGVVGCVWCHVSELVDGTVETVDGSSRDVRISDTRLLISFSDVADTGRYVCNATNDVGVDTAAAYLSVLGKTHLESMTARSEYVPKNWRPCIFSYC